MKDEFHMLDGIYDLDKNGIEKVVDIISEYDMSFNELDRKLPSGFRLKYIKGHPHGRGKIMAFLTDYAFSEKGVEKHIDTFTPPTHVSPNRNLETEAFLEIIRYLRSVKIDQIINKIHEDN
jgi:hypothetical protein